MISEDWLLSIHDERVLFVQGSCLGDVKRLKGLLLLHVHKHTFRNMGGPILIIQEGTDGGRGDEGKGVEKKKWAYTQ